MRIACEEPGFEAAFLEFADSGWTRAHLAAVRDLNESEEWFANLRARLTGCFLPVVSGEPVTEPEGVTPALLDAMDLVLYNWFITAVIQAVQEVTRLGEAPWRRLRAAREATATETPPTP